MTNVIPLAAARSIGRAVFTRPAGSVARSSVAPVLEAKKRIAVSSGGARLHLNGLVPERFHSGCLCLRQRGFRITRKYFFRVSDRPRTILVIFQSGGPNFKAPEDDAHEFSGPHPKPRSSRILRPIETPALPLQRKLRVAFQCSLSRESLSSGMHFASICT